MGLPMGHVFRCRKSHQMEGAWLLLGAVLHTLQYRLRIHVNTRAAILFPSRRCLLDIFDRGMPLLNSVAVT